MWPYLVIVFFVAVQGELVILVAAGAASMGYLNLFGVLGAAMLGNICSDVLWYAVGYFSRLDWLFKQFRWLGITADKVNLASRIVRKDALRLLIFAKLTNWLAIPALIATGLAKTPWKKWLWFIILSDVVIATIFGLLGYFLTNSVLQIQSGMRYVAIGLTFVFVLGSAFYVRKLLGRGGLLDPQDDAERTKGS
jgi:membrane protein DedA with SNARE-associated domain